MFNSSDISIILGILFIFLILSSVYCYYICCFGTDKSKYIKHFYYILIIILIFAVLYNINNFLKQDTILNNYNIVFIIFMFLLIIYELYNLHKDYSSNDIFFDFLKI